MAQPEVQVDVNAAQPQNGPPQVQVAAAQPQVVVLGNQVAGQTRPCSVRCPYCQTVVVTRIDEVWSSMDLVMLIIFLIFFL